MKHLQILLFSLFLFFFSLTNAQQNHYIYLQTENKQPFYLKLDNKQYSSSISGYLIVPKLKDGSYTLTIGFPKGEWPEQSMVCNVADNDIGYLLKNFGEKGWGLFNLQSMDIIMAANKGKAENIEVVNKTDAFSNMLSSVVNDSTIRQTEVIIEDVKTAPVNEVEKVTPAENSAKEMEVVAEKTKEESKSTETQDEIKNPVVAKDLENTAIAKGEVIAINEVKSSITRSLFSKNVDGIEMVYVDFVNGTRDTIRVFIPAEKNAESVVEEKSDNIDHPTEKGITQEPTKTTEEKTKDVRFLEIELPNPNEKPVDIKPVENKSIDNKVAIENKPAENTLIEGKEMSKVKTNNSSDKSIEQKVPMINSDCKNFAMDDDFLRLRKKMVAKDVDDEMILIAKKLFKVKCFTVDQVKNLSVLFLKDSGKYAFFDMAYPFVADSHNFHILQNQLSDNYYINRFQVMIRH